MTAGRSTILEFPCEVNHTVLGLEEEIKLQTGPDNKKTVTLWLNSPVVQPTNLVAKCSDEYYVFDIIPNKYNHQDFVDIVDAFDSRTETKLELIASSANPPAIKTDQSEGFEINESDLLGEIKKSSDPTPQELILKALNKNSKPKRYIRTVTQEEFEAEVFGKSKKTRRVR